MSAKKRGTGTKEVSPELRRAIADDAQDCFVDRPILTASDVATLKGILAGEMRPPVGVDRKRAIVALTTNDRTPETARILGDILGDRQEALQVRGAAAALLGNLEAEDAEQVLLEHLKTGEPMLRREVVQSLAGVGSRRSLTALKKLPEPTRPDERVLLEFTRAIIATRIGDPSRPVQSIGGVWKRQTARPIELARARQYLEAITGSTYGIVPDPASAIEFPCGREMLALFLNQELTSTGGIAMLQRAPILAGLVLLKEREVLHLTVRNVIIASPSPGGVAVRVARRSGEVILSGDAREDGDSLRIELRDVGIERTPTRIEGTIAGDGIALAIEVWQGTTRPKGRGIAIEPTI